MEEARGPEGWMVGHASNAVQLKTLSSITAFDSPTKKGLGF